jgi:hypothetical protein
MPRRPCGPRKATATPPMCHFQTRRATFPTPRCHCGVRGRGSKPRRGHCETRNGTVSRPQSACGRCWASFPSPAHVRAPQSPDLPQDGRNSPGVGRRGVGGGPCSQYPRRPPPPRQRDRKVVSHRPRRPSAEGGTLAQNLEDHEAGLFRDRTGPTGSVFNPRGTDARTVPLRRPIEPRTAGRGISEVTAWRSQKKTKPSSGC